MMIRQPVAADKYYSGAVAVLNAELQRCLDAPAPNVQGGPCLHCPPAHRRHLRGLIVSLLLAYAVLYPEAVHTGKLRNF